MSEPITVSGAISPSEWVTLDSDVVRDWTEPAEIRIESALPLPIIFTGGFLVTADAICPIDGGSGRRVGMSTMSGPSGDIVAVDMTFQLTLLTPFPAVVMNAVPGVLIHGSLGILACRITDDDLNGAVVTAHANGTRRAIPAGFPPRILAGFEQSLLLQETADMLVYADWLIERGWDDYATVVRELAAAMKLGKQRAGE